VLWGDIDLYELTGDEKFKKAADQWASLIYAGQKQNGAWGEDYNPVKNRWEKEPHGSYMREYTLPALIAYHQLTGNKAIADCIVKATDYFMKTEEYGAYFDSSAYSYWLTGNKKYLDNLQNRLDFSINHQQHSDDPLLDGMIYQKAFYARVMEYLYKTPFAFEALAEPKKTEQRTP
jgi:rhamnogalacturonyl hydrolase YesR